MKTLKYILIFMLSMGFFNSCLIEDTTDLDQNGQGPSLVTFDGTGLVNLTVLANGSEYDKTIKVLVVGPTKFGLTGDLTVTVKPAANSTAVEGKHYILDKTLVLKASDNYLGYVNITLLTEGNTPPMDGTPEADTYKAPILYLEVESVTGESGVVASGKTAQVNLNFTPPNPYAGEYSTVMYYWHPTAGGDYPPKEGGAPFGGVRTDTKELSPITGRKCETGFAVWGDTDICWITVNADNSINFEVDVTWPYDVKMGDPTDATKVSHFDPETGIIYLYYHYTGSGGDRIFWETFTPNF